MEKNELDEIRSWKRLAKIEKENAESNKLELDIEKTDKRRSEYVTT